MWACPTGAFDLQERSGVFQDISAVARAVRNRRWTRTVARKVSSPVPITSPAGTRSRRWPRLTAQDAVPGSWSRRYQATAFGAAITARTRTSSGGRAPRWGQCTQMWDNARDFATQADAGYDVEVWVATGFNGLRFQFRRNGHCE